MQKTRWYLGRGDTLDEAIEIGRANGDFNCKDCGRAFVDVAEMHDAKSQNELCDRCMDELRKDHVLGEILDDQRMEAENELSIS